MPKALGMTCFDKNDAQTRRAKTGRIIMKLDRRDFLLTASAVTLLTAAGCAPRVNAPAAATLQGPIQGAPYRGSNEQPVAGSGATPPDLVANNYVEEEYFVSGEVDGQAYTTSLLVRKPS